MSYLAGRSRETLTVKLITDYQKFIVKNGMHGMVIDRIENAGQYYCIGKQIESALEYLQKTDFSKFPPGRYDIDGDEVYALVQHYDTTKEPGVWEAHQKYIDIQYNFRGAERIGYANIQGMKVTKEYSRHEDCLHCAGEGDFLTLKEKMFMILCPEDAHMPRIAAKESEPVIKVVIKVMCDS